MMQETVGLDLEDETSMALAPYRVQHGTTMLVERASSSLEELTDAASAAPTKCRRFSFMDDPAMSGETLSVSVDFAHIGTRLNIACK